MEKQYKINMQLSELAEIQSGLKVDLKLLFNEKKLDGLYFPYLQASDFAEGKSHFILQKEIRKIERYSKRMFLFYGDYILYKKDANYQFLRYEGPTGETIVGEGLFVIKPELSILKDFLSFEKNKKYFSDELQRINKEDGNLSIDKISQIKIGTNDILELEEANKAEKIGMRKPIDIKKNPINVLDKPLPIGTLLARIEHGELLLDAEFQRKAGLWDYPIKSRLIESMIIGLPIPAFYFDGSNDDKWLIIDGLQRISAINDFVAEKFVLTELDYLPEIETKSFSQLEQKYQRNIKEYAILAYIIKAPTLKGITYKIFKTINTSALKLESQEIRHAINPGVPATFLKEIATKEWFKKGFIFTDRQRDRMEDRETALRFVAFQRTKFSEYSPEISDFLDLSMTDIYDIPEHKRELYINELENIFKIIYETLGENAFSRSLVDDTGSYGHNNILFELLTYGVSILSKEKRNQLFNNSMKFKEIILNHFTKKPSGFWEFKKAYSKEGLIKRFSEIEILFKNLSFDDASKVQRTVIKQRPR
jgi:hypothetical protein